VLALGSAAACRLAAAEKIRSYFVLEKLGEVTKHYVVAYFEIYEDISLRSIWRNKKFRANIQKYSEVYEDIFLRSI